MNASAAAGLRRIHASAAGLRRINASAAAAGSMNFSLLLPPGPLESLRDGLNQTVGLPAEGSALFNKVFYGIIAADVVIFVLLPSLTFDFAAGFSFLAGLLSAIGAA